MPSMSPSEYLYINTQVLLYKYCSTYKEVLEYLYSSTDSYTKPPKEPAATC